MREREGKGEGRRESARASLLKRASKRARESKRECVCKREGWRERTRARARARARERASERARKQPCFNSAARKKKGNPLKTKKTQNLLREEAYERVAMLGLIGWIQVVCDLSEAFTGFRV